MASERVTQLKLLLGELKEPIPKEYIVAPSLPMGLPRGVIVELIGPSRTEWLIQFLVNHKDFRIFWAERDQSILPTALYQRGLNLNRVTFGTLGEDLLPLRRVLQSQLYQVVIAPNRFSEIRIFKALQLSTEKANSILFLMGDKEASKAWPISVQLSIQKDSDNQFRIEVLRQKHGMGDA